MSIMLSARAEAQALVDQAWEAAKKQPDGGVAEDDLIEALRVLLPEEDPDARARKRCKSLIKLVEEPPARDTVRYQLTFAFIDEPVPYDPGQLVRDEFRSLNRHGSAQVRYLMAKASRSGENRRAIDRWDDYHQGLAREFASWTISEMRRGRPEVELIFDAFVRETGALAPTAVPA